MQRGRVRRSVVALVCLWLGACSSSEATLVPAAGSAGGRGGTVDVASMAEAPASESGRGGVASTGGARGEGGPALGRSSGGGTVRAANPIERDAGAPVDAGSSLDRDAATGPAPTVAPRADAGAVADAGASEPDPEIERLARLSGRLAPLAERTLAFWLEHGPDAPFGGFHATLDRRGAPIAPTNKGLVQQARHLWMLSTWYERRGARSDIAALAEAQYEFFARSFLDPVDGGFVLAVSRDGTRVVDARKQMYAESFALYALATYGRVFDVPAATELALQRFESIDASRHDPRFGGYDQRGDPGFLSPGADKDTNTHLHLMESFTALYEATGDARVGARLDELARLIANTLRQATDAVHPQFTLDWTPFGAPFVSYGHDLETAWLLLEAARALGRPADVELGAAARAIAEHSASRGFDAVRGGYFESGIPAGPATDLDKIWWVQFEALAGLWWAYELSGDSIQLDRLEQTTTWLEATEDLPFGEWFATTNPDGSAAGGADYKGDEWKASYHDIRALVFVQDWMDAERALRTRRSEP